MTSFVEKALEFARKKHKDQTHGESPFIMHPLEVFEIINLLYPTDYNLQAAALLHDVIEDGGVDYDTLIVEFNRDVADLVFEVTKTKRNTFPNLKTHRGVILKFADRLSNIRHMERWTEQRRKEYMFEKSRFWKTE